MGLESIIGVLPLMGTSNPKLDDKGRLLLPAKFRARMAPGLVLVKGQELCLYLYPLDEFAKFYETWQAADVTQKEARDYLRVMLSGASDEVPDKQGRVSIPQHLREYAGLDRDVTVNGVGNRLEVWDTTAWEKYLSEKQPGYAEIASRILPGSAF